MNRYLTNIENLLTSFCELIKQEGVLKLPGIELSPDSSVASLVADMSTAEIQISSKDSVNKVTDYLFEKFIEYMMDELNIGRTEVISIVSTNIGVTLMNAFTELTETIGSEVDDLFKLVEARYKENLKLNGAVDLQDTEVDESMYSVLRWNDLNSKVVQTLVVEEANKNAGFTDVDLSRMRDATITQKAKFSVSDIAIDGDLREVVLSELINVLSAKSFGLTVPSVKEMFSVITSSRRYSGFVSQVQKLMKSPTDLAKNTMTLLGIVKNFDVFNKNSVVILGDVLSGSKSTELKSNIENLTKTLYAIKYHCLVQKELAFKGSIVFSDYILNEDEYKLFTKAGGRVRTIYDFARIRFSDEIPETGISRELIVGTDVEKELAVINNSLQRRRKFITTKALIDAFVLECRIYFKQNEDVDQITCERIVDSLANRLKGEIANAQDVLYDVILQVSYSNTLVSRLHRHLGSTFKTMFEDNDSVTPEDILLSEYEAAVHIVTDYLFSSLLSK